MPDPLQFNKIELDSFSAGAPKVLELGVSGRKLIYGRGVRTRIDVPSEQLDVELQGLNADVVAALRLSAGSGDNTQFVTLDLNHTLTIWTVHGKMVRVVIRHKKPVHGLWELSGERLATWGEEHKLFICETAGRYRIKRIPARVQSVEHLLFMPSGKAVCITGWLKSTRIVSLQRGKPDIRLWGQSEPPTAAQELNGTFLLVTKTGVQLRAANGKLLTALPQFSLKEGLLVFPSQHGRYADHLHIVDEQHGLRFLHPSGATRAARAPDEAVAKAVREYFKGHVQGAKAIEAANLKQLGFRENPFSDLRATDDDGQKPPSDDTAEDLEQLWHFFHRPRNARIQSLLHTEIQTAREAQRSVSGAISEDEARRLHAQRTARIARNLTLVPAIVLSDAVAVFLRLLPSRFGAAPWQNWMALCALVAGWFTYSLYRGEAKRMVSAAGALSSLREHISTFVQSAALKRSDLRDKLPGVVMQSLYSGASIRRSIDASILEVERNALQRFQLKSNQLITFDKRCLILRDWSLVARVDGEQTTPNIRSFWWTKSGELFLAVERIQVVLPTSHRLYVYRVDYDFVTRTSYNEERHVVYYDEIVDIIIRDKQRAVVLPRATSTLSTKEMEVVSTGGASISLGALHDRCAEALYEAWRATTAASYADVMRNLETEIQHCATPAEQDRIELERRTLAEEMLTGVPVDNTRDAVDRVLNQIKSLILGKTDPATRTGSAWPKSPRTQSDFN